MVSSRHHRAVTRQTLLLGFTLFCAGLPGIALDFLHDDDAAVADGRDLYLRNCAACHGANLEGQPDWQSPGADGLYRAPPHDAQGHTSRMPVRLFQGTLPA